MSFHPGNEGSYSSRTSTCSESFEDEAIQEIHSDVEDGFGKK